MPCVSIHLINKDYLSCTMKILYINKLNQMKQILLILAATFFLLSCQNQIIALGGTTYHKGEQLMKVGISLKRAIIGGTGKYSSKKKRLKTKRKKSI